MRITIKLNEMCKIKRFTQVVSSFESDVDLIKGRYVIDGKSTMGLFTLDLSEPVDVRIYTENREEENNFIEAMKEFM